MPLTTANGMFGLLSIGASTPREFTADHFRFAKSLAMPAAAVKDAKASYAVPLINKDSLETDQDRQLLAGSKA